jgi:hypothetical protein
MAVEHKRNQAKKDSLKANRTKKHQLSLNPLSIGALSGCFFRVLIKYKGAFGAEVRDQNIAYNPSGVKDDRSTCQH